jgi:hypothetical protein
MWMRIVESPFIFGMRLTRRGRDKVKEGFGPERAIGSRGADCSKAACAPLGRQMHHVGGNYAMKQNNDG